MVRSLKEERGTLACLLTVLCLNSSHAQVLGKQGENALGVELVTQALGNHPSSLPGLQLAFVSTVKVS